MIRSGSVKLITRQDGLARLEIFDRPDGLFFFEEYTFVKDEYGDYFYPTHISGLYPNEQEAMKEAYAIIPWLRSNASN
jgi:hypothetical protein